MNRKFYLHFLPLLLLLCCVSELAFSQDPRSLRRPGTVTPTDVQYDRNGRVLPNASKGNDSLKRRDNTDDSITIYFRYFDSTRIRTIDSSISNFYARFPVPLTYITLGNFGTAARSLIFRPNLKAGFDPGFHAFDIYRLTFEDTRFYQTTRPYTELGYMIGSKSEQMINIVHTQNIKPNFNMAFQYRFMNSPGNFQAQNTSHNNFRINGNYQSNNKRYTAYGIFISNKLRSGENGGIQNDSALDKNGLNDRFEVATRLASVAQPIRSPFNTKINTGNEYDETSFLFRHQYDIGQKDSLVVNDSTVIRLFYPRLRLQHTLRLSKQKFAFHDNASDSININNYKKYFNYPRLLDTLLFRDTWNDLTNEFSIISFPEKNNLNQFLKVGAAVQNLSANFGNITRKYHNIYLLGEYRNRTRNQKWDLEANGQLYLNGLNSGDYAAQASLKRVISKKLGSLELGFQNVNRTPSFVFTPESAFPVVALNTFGKENTTRIWGIIDNAQKNFKLSGEYYLLSNYTYFDSFFTARQEATLFNVLHLSAEKKFRLNRKWNLYSEVHVQQTSGNPPLNLPLFLTINRLAHETTPYKNLVLSYGLEVRYHTPYKADNYSPFVGQFFYQDHTTISNRPDINAFFNFRIKSFKAFVRAENLNTLRNNNGIGFTKSNLSAEHYPNPGLWIRVGIWWTFVN